MNNPIDISMPITNDAVVYPGDDPLAIESLCEIDSTCPCNITKLGGWTTHFLTHVDPPLHFVKEGKSLDDIPLERFMGEAIVVEVQGDAVRATDVPPEDIKGINVLFKTRNSGAISSGKFDEQHVYVTKEAAELLVEKGVNLVGIDYIGIDRYGDETYPAHKVLLGNAVLILEGINLTNVNAERYTLLALPLKIIGGDGSPVRAVLIPQE